MDGYQVGKVLGYRTEKWWYYFYFAGYVENAFSDTERSSPCVNTAIYSMLSESLMLDYSGSKEREWLEDNAKLDVRLQWFQGKGIGLKIMPR